MLACAESLAPGIDPGPGVFVEAGPKTLDNQIAPASLMPAAIRPRTEASPAEDLSPLL
jgi:hypothetical protein